jgi:hypothetical protein
MAYRVVANLGFGSNTASNVVGLNNQEVKSSSFDLTAGLGKEWRKGSTRLQGFYGADALIGFSSEKWSETNKTGKIITFGTLGTELSENILKQVGADLNYIKQKIHLENVHRLLSIKTPFGTQPQSVLIRILNYGEKVGVRQSEPFCDTQDIIRIFNTVLNEPLYISTIDVRKI